MPVCSECGSLFFVGGVKAGSRKFCSERCAEKGKALLVADAIDPADIQRIATSFFDRACPICGKENGGVDIQRDHRLISAIVVQTFQNRRLICCRSCALKAQFGTLGLTSVLGWWSIRGIFMTPIWLGWNAIEIGKTLRRKPSRELSELLARETAESLLANAKITESQ